MNEPIEQDLEVLRPNLTREEECLSALLELRDFREEALSWTADGFYSAHTGQEAPEGLRTRISTHAAEQDPQDPTRSSIQKSFVKGYEISATTIVEFDARYAGLQDRLVLDFVNTSEGLRLMQREPVVWDHGVVLRYAHTREIGKSELAALALDAKAIKELIVEEEAELARLGPLVEAKAGDGSRRFHIGDVLSITTGWLLSPRGMEGIYDILAYMTGDDSVTSSQLERFAEECYPYLIRQLGEAIEPYSSELPETISDRLSLYRWLNYVTEAMDGDPFLEVGMIDEADHVTMDYRTELELDHGTATVDRGTEHLF